MLPPFRASKIGEPYENSRHSIVYPSGANFFSKEPSLWSRRKTPDFWYPIRITFAELPEEIEAAAVAHKSKAKIGLQTAMNVEERILVRYSQMGMGGLQGKR